MKNSETAPRGRKRGFKSDRFRDVLLLSALALLLIFAVWKIFYPSGNARETAAITGASESEQKLCALLKEIDGVGDVIVVVCEGANDLRVNMNIREAVAAALGTDEKSVKIYLMKE